MILSRFLSAFKSKETKHVAHATPIEIAYIEGLEKGIDIGMNIGPSVLEKVHNNAKAQAIKETLDRFKINGNRL